MHIVFLNPQGNFDPTDAHLTEHPDFGGQLVYVKEVALAMARQGIQVDIVTRRVEDPAWPEFSAAEDRYEGYPDNPRIIRLECGGPGFLEKERLWAHLPAFADAFMAFYGDRLPDFATGHYGDGGWCGVLIQSRSGLPFTLTGHSLGAQKLDKLGLNLDNFEAMEARYHFSKRIAAERLAMSQAAVIITSTAQERFEQYGHPLYHGAVSVSDDDKFAVIPPGVNTRIFTTAPGPDDAAARAMVADRTGGGTRPGILVSSRLDEKKNHMGVVQAYADSPALRERADLILAVRGAPDPYADISGLPDAERAILGRVIDLLRRNGLTDRVHFLDIRSQGMLAAVYRVLGERGSVFALTAFYEPFGLAPIEAAACGLAVVATGNGGPSEIFQDDTGVLVDPFNNADIARGLEQALARADHYAKAGGELVKRKYTWDQTADNYLAAIRRAMASNPLHGYVPDDSLGGGRERLQSYLLDPSRF